MFWTEVERLGQREPGMAVGSSAEGARLVVFWGEQCNWGGGAAALRAEARARRRAGYEPHACMQEDTYHKAHSPNSYCGKRARRLPQASRKSHASV